MHAQVADANRFVLFARFEAIVSIKIIRYKLTDVFEIDENRRRVMLAWMRLSRPPCLCLPEKTRSCQLFPQSRPAASYMDSTSSLSSTGCFVVTHLFRSLSFSSMSTTSSCSWTDSSPPGSVVAWSFASFKLSLKSLVYFFCQKFH